MTTTLARSSCFSISSWAIRWRKSPRVTASDPSVPPRRSFGRFFSAKDTVPQPPDDGARDAVLPGGNAPAALDPPRREPGAPLEPQPPRPDGEPRDSVSGGGPPG